MKLLNTKGNYHNENDLLSMTIMKIITETTIVVTIIKNDKISTVLIIKNDYNNK